MMLEASLHGDNSFVTLTYSEENLPSDNSVNPAEVSNFIKRLRKGGSKIRFFAVGEYGDNTGRPHYHLSLFGFAACYWGGTRKQDVCCDRCEIIKAVWKKGNIFVAGLEEKSMAYVAGYINKKMTKDDDPRLEGRRPEFARMSLKPGIGYGMMHEVASALMEHDLEKQLLDVPMTLRHGNIQYPLGRYLRRSLRAMIGRDKNASQEALEQQKEELQALRKAAYDSSTPLREAVLEQSLGRRIQISARYARKKKVDRL